MNKRDLIREIRIPCTLEESSRLRNICKEIVDSGRDFDRWVFQAIIHEWEAEARLTTSIEIKDPWSEEEWQEWERIAQRFKEELETPVEEKGGKQ